MGRGARIGVLGATGALGSEVLAALDASRLRIGEIVAVATERSLGEDIEFQGEVYPVAAERPALKGLDLVFACAPPAPSLEWIREALRAEVPCIDCSGALLASGEVPLRVAALPPLPEAEGQPAVATPSGAALAWSLVLAPLQRAAGLRRVSGTVMESASAGGRDGVTALSAETLALFNQQESNVPAAFGRPLAFDCHPSLEPPEEDGHAPREQDLGRSVQRLLDAEFGVAATFVQIPTFLGQASVLSVETEEPLDPKEAEDFLAQAPGIDLWRLGGEGPNLRAAAGRDVVVVGRTRRDPSSPRGLLLWLAADPLRLSAANAVALAVARLQPH